MARVEFPPGLTPGEAWDLWHLSEGSDVFPLRWFLHIRSQTSPVPNTPLSEQLDKKFGLISEAGLGAYGDRHRYPLKYVGLTAAWSDADPTNSDARLASPDEKITDSEIYSARALPTGQKSIAMVGTNCAFCHTGSIQVGSQRRLIDGAPGLIYIRGFFQDLAGSTVKTLLDPELLKALLKEVGKSDAEATTVAERMAHEFKTELLGAQSLAGSLVAKLVQDIAQSNVLPKGALLAQNKLKEKVARALYEKRDVVQRYLTELLMVTYGLRQEELTPTLHLRMKWLATLLGANPDLKTTNEGYARTDAFGRISNWVARGDKPISLTATVSVPPMWAIRYKAAFHYNSNTNSVIMRNVGQAFGLGAIMTGTGPCSAGSLENCTSTVNMHNLNRLESLLYKLKTPNWQEHFPNAPVNMQMAMAGCTTFQKTCAGCHDSHGNRVGPARKLIPAKLFPVFNGVGTDGDYPKLQGTPVTVKEGGRERDIPFREALFTFTKNVRDQYFRQHNIPPSEVAVWQREDMRGPEVFRDTYLGEKQFGGFVDYMDNSGRPGEAYSPRNLAGVWATAPYLHNGSIPNLEVLLTRASQRPKFFFLGTQVYDPDRLGFQPDPVTYENVSFSQRWAHWGRDFLITRTTRAERDNIIRCILHSPNCFNASDAGNSNSGHEFGTDLPAADKRNLIEFMKILRPEPEYSWTTPPTYQVLGMDGPTSNRRCTAIN